MMQPVFRWGPVLWILLHDDGPLGACVHTQAAPDALFHIIGVLLVTERMGVRIANPHTLSTVVADCLIYVCKKVWRGQRDAPLEQVNCLHIVAAAIAARADGVRAGRFDIGGEEDKVFLPPIKDNVVHLLLAHKTPVTILDG